MDGPPMLAINERRAHCLQLWQASDLNAAVCKAMMLSVRCSEVVAINRWLPPPHRYRQAIRLRETPEPDLEMKALLHATNN